MHLALGQIDELVVARLDLRNGLDQGGFVIGGGHIDGDEGARPMRRHLHVLATPDLQVEKKQPVHRDQLSQTMMLSMMRQEPSLRAR